MPKISELPNVGSVASTDVIPIVDGASTTKKATVAQIIALATTTPGPQGPQGEPGPQGPQGETGPAGSGVPGLTGTGTTVTATAHTINYLGNERLEEIVKWRFSGPISSAQWDVGLYALAPNETRKLEQHVLMYSQDGTYQAEFVVKALCRRVGTADVEVLYTTTEVLHRTQPEMNAWIHASGVNTTLSFTGVTDDTPIAVSYINRSMRGKHWG